MTAGNCKSGMIKAPTLPSAAAGSLALCFDVDCDPGLEIDGEVNDHFLQEFFVDRPGVADVAGVLKP